MQDVLAPLGLVGYNEGLDLSCIPCLSYSNKQRRTKDGFAAFDALLALLTSDLSPLSPLVFAKNLRLDAQRRNEEQIFWLWNEEPLFCPFEGRVHDLGRRTKDGYSAFNGYLGGRRTDNGVRLLKMESVPFFSFFSRQSLISGHYAAG